MKPAFWFQLLGAGVKFFIPRLGNDVRLKEVREGLEVKQEGWKVTGYPILVITPK